MPLSRSTSIVASKSTACAVRWIIRSSSSDILVHPLAEYVRLRQPIDVAAGLVDHFVCIGLAHAPRQRLGAIEDAVDVAAFEKAFFAQRIEQRLQQRRFASEAD